MAEQQPWADSLALTARYPSEGIPPEVYQEALEAATWMLFVMANGMVHGEQCWVEEYRITHTCEIQLRRGPIKEIAKVERVQGCGRGAPELIDPSEYCIVRNQTLSFCHGKGVSGWSDGWLHSRLLCGCGDDAVRITYTIADNLPPGTEGLVLWLAEQLLRSGSGDTCSLPERITAISRQGVSWTMLDSMDFLDKGYFGVGRIDQWLATVRRAYPPAVIIDPVRSERLISYQCTTPTPSSERPMQVNAEPQTVNLLLYEGDDFSLNLTVYNSVGGPADLAGATAKAEIRSDTESDVVLATFDSTITDNVVHLHLPGAATEDLPDGVWDCQLTLVDGTISTIAAGSARFRQEVTRP